MFFYKNLMTCDNSRVNQKELYRLEFGFWKGSLWVDNSTSFVLFLVAMYQVGVTFKTQMFSEDIYVLIKTFCLLFLH